MSGQYNVNGGYGWPVATESTPVAKPLRITAIVLGGLIMLVSLIPWVGYLFLSVLAPKLGQGLDWHVPEALMVVFAWWLVPWLLGAAMVAMGVAEWIRGAVWVVLALTGVMLAIPVVATVIGAMVV